MKLFLGVGMSALIFLGAGPPASAQMSSPHPLGGVKRPGGATARPLGGIAIAGWGGRRGGQGNRVVYPYPYAYSFYVPNYFDSYDDTYGPSAPPEPPPAPAPPTQPVVINQYFGAPPPPPPGYDQAPPPQQPASNEPPASGGEHYLLAFKNHSVFEVQAYWVEDKTMHYVTAGNKHNQASLDQIDQDLTKTLNDGR